MDKPGKHLAVLAYLLGPLGWLFVFLFQRKNEFVVYHAKQSLLLNMLAVCTPAVWAIVAWFISWIPFLGPVVAVTLFTLVIAVYILLIVAWVTGIVYALRAEAKPVVFVGGWAERLPIKSSVATHAIK